MAATAVLKADGSIHALVAHGATALHMTHREVVDAAVREYLADRRDTINARLSAVIAQIDRTETSEVAALAGLSPETGRSTRATDARSAIDAQNERCYVLCD